MLNGNKSPTDILASKELDEYASLYSSRFKLINIVGESPDDKPAGWNGETGWIDEAKVKKYCFPPSTDTRSVSQFHFKSHEYISLCFYVACLCVVFPLCMILCVAHVIRRRYSKAPFSTNLVILTLWSRNFEHEE